MAGRPKNTRMAGGTLKAPALRYVELTVRKSRVDKGFAGQLHITTRSTWRYFGFLAARCRRERLALCRQLLGAPEAEPAVAAEDYRDRFEHLTGRSLRDCPACRSGQMFVAGRFEPGDAPPALEDTS